MKACCIFLLFTVIAAGAAPLSAGESDIFIYPFEFAGFSVKEQQTYSANMGKILAAEFQDQLFKAGGYNPSTLTNMQSQLQKEKQKEVLDCKNTVCLQKIIDNFGFSDTVFGKVTKAGSKLQIYITLVRDDKVVKSKTGWCQLEIDSLIQQVKAMAKEMFKGGSGTKKSAGVVKGTIEKDESKTIVKKDNLVLDEVGVFISTEPGDAFLKINDQEVGAAPFQDFLTVGNHIVKAYKPMYVSEEMTIKITGADAGTTQKFSMKLKPDFCSLDIKSSPSGAHLFINDQQAGDTPHLQKQIKLGSYKLKLFKKNYLPKTIEVECGDKDRGLVKNVTVDLTGDFGSLKINTQPQGAAVRLDGKDKGLTPLTDNMLKSGIHKIKLTLDGHYDFETSVKIDQGGTHVINETLTPKMCVVKIKSVDEKEKAVSGDISIDGEVKGKTPAILKLICKGHDIKITSKKGSWNGSIILSEGEKKDIKAVIKSVNKSKPDKYGMVWVTIPGGTFTMGCSLSDSKCKSQEKPPHKVKISTFEMLETEVTESQYKAVTGKDPSKDHNGGGGPNSPVENVTWYKAKAFCKAVGGYLPTEAQWEYAARGGTTTKYYCGDSPSCLDDIAWHKGNSGNHKHDVKGKKPNAYGLYDMLGNVYEWVADWNNGSYYYKVSPEDNPTGPISGSGRVVRGGGFGNAYDYLRVSYRLFYAPSVDVYFLGFRCARSK